ncbi:unnamed protein product, partial [marine sediment metagenome]
IIEKDLSVGLGMQIQDEIYWRIYSEKYWIDCEDPYIVPHENELYIVVPYKTYEYHFAFPTFYTVPKWGGVVLVNSDGELTWLTPEVTISNVLRSYLVSRCGFESRRSKKEKSAGSRRFQHLTCFPSPSERTALSP